MQSTKIPLSISIVTYETVPALLESALASVANSTIPARIDIVDNSPCNRLQDVATKYGATYLCAGENLGYGRGHNLALKAVGRSSKYHLLLNPDVSFEPSILNEIYEFMEMNPQIGWVMPKVLYPDGAQQDLCKRLPTPWDLFSRRFLANRTGPFVVESQNRFKCKDLDLTRPRCIPNLSGCCAFVRTDLLQAAGGFDERFFLYLEDTDLVRRIGEVSLTVFYPYASVSHVHGRGSYRNLKLLGHHLLSTVRYFSKWGWFIDDRRAEINRSIASDDRNLTIPDKFADWATN